MRIVELEISQEECRRLAAEARGRASLSKNDAGEIAYWTHLADKWSWAARSYETIPLQRMISGT